MNAAPPIAELRDVSFAYRPGQPVLQDVSLTIEPRDFMGVIGPNGGGKTTLIKLMLGLLEPQSGSVRVFGRPPREVGARIGYVPQQAQIDATVPASVLDVVLMGRLSRSAWGVRFRAEDHDAARAALRETGCEDLADRAIDALSGGQRQRVLLARAVCGGAELLLLDEPMAGVDVHMQKELLDLLHRLHQRMPIVMISHDMAYVSTRFNRVACCDRHLDTHEAADVTSEIITDMYHGDVRWIRHAHDCDHHHPDRDHDHDHSHDHDHGRDRSGEQGPAS